MTVNPMTILYAVLTLGVLGGGFGAILAVASKIFAAPAPSPLSPAPRR